MLHRQNVPSAVLSHPQSLNPSDFTITSSFLPCLALDGLLLLLLKSQVLHRVRRHQVPVFISSATIPGSSPGVSFSPLHPTSQVAFTQRPALLIIHTLMALQALEVSLHNRLTLRLMIQRKTAPLRRYRLRESILPTRRSKRRHLPNVSLSSSSRLNDDAQGEVWPQSQLVQWDPCRG